MENLGYVAVPCILVLCYLGCELFKAIDKNEDHKIFLPVASGLFGLILGVVALYTAPEVISASDPFTAAAIGAFSGLSATGANQIYKQLTKGYRHNQRRDR